MVRCIKQAAVLGVGDRAKPWVLLFVDGLGRRLRSNERHKIEEAGEQVCKPLIEFAYHFRFSTSFLYFSFSFFV